MEQIILSQNKSSLLAYATSKLSPEVFSHPVWVRFGQKDASDYTGLIGDLFSAANGLQEDDPSGACQILLICAVYQNHAGQRYNAINTVQRAVSLAEHHRLMQEMIWAIWGASAISFQQRNYEEAANHLLDLQGVFGAQNEWMLANFVDIFRQFLLKPATFGESQMTKESRDRSFEDMLSFPLEWFQHWGSPLQTSERELEAIPEATIRQTATHMTLIQSFFSIQGWQGRWHTLLLAIRGELRLQWLNSDPSASLGGISLWGSFLSKLGMDQPNLTMDSQNAHGTHPMDNAPLLPPPKESSVPETPVRKRKSKAQNAKTTVKHRSKKAASLTPVAVHMLGPFRMTIGDTAVKLPASRGLSLLKYLLLHHKQSSLREVLMDVFWPEAEPGLARNNLNVAMHNLRKALFAITDLPMIIFANGLYTLPSDLEVWLDIEEFDRCVKAGQRLEARNQLSAAVKEYETAISLYQGDFLEQDLYEEWTIMDRERLRVNYLDTLDRLSQIYFDQERYAACITVCQLILTRDRCREDAHCLLMRCYSRQGQSHLALRQFQTCIEALRGELDTEPELTTAQLAERIRRHERI